MKEENSRINRFITLIIISSPILNIYKVGQLPISFGELALSVSIVIYLLMNLRSIVLYRNGTSFLTVFSIFFLVTIISVLSQRTLSLGDFFSKWSRIFVFCIVLDLVVRDMFEYRFACQVCTKLSFTLSVSVIVQELLRISGINVFPYIGVFPLNYSLQKMELVELLRRRAAMGIWRVSSIFPEPAHFSYYVLLGLAIVLFCEDYLLYSEKKRLIISVVLTAAILISTSATGLFLCGILWILWIVHTFRDEITLERLSIVLAVMFAGGIVAVKTGALDKAMYRLNTTWSYAEGATGAVRFLQGIYVYKQLGFWHQMVGVGFGNISNFLSYNQITTPFLKEVGNEYMNAFSTVAVSGGMVCFSIFILLWIKIARCCESALAKICMLMITLLFCSASIFYSCITIFYLAFVLAPFKKNYEK